MCTRTRGGGGVDRAVCLCVCVGVSWRDTYEGCALYAPPRACVSYYVVDKREAGLEKRRERREREGVFCVLARAFRGLPAGLSF